MKSNKLFALLLCLAIVLSLTPVISVTVAANPEANVSYTLTVPAQLSVANAGWNATDGISAQTEGTSPFLEYKYVAVAAESANEWKLVSGENAIDYVLTTEEDGDQTTVWKFEASELNAEGGTTKPMGIMVDDFSNAPFGSYADTVIFTASVEALDVVISKTGEDDVLMSLADFGASANAGNTYEGYTVTLLHDVDLSGSLWTPIEGFAGTFNGAEYTISGLTIEAPDGMGAFFNTCGDGATIMKVQFADVDVSGKYVAVVVADAEKTKNLTLTSIYVVSGTVTATSYAAGIVFDAEGENLTLMYCSNGATISGGSASGIGAWVYPGANSNVAHLSNGGSIEGTNRAGGIFGNWGGSNLSYCENYGNVVSEGGMPAGGIVGVLGAKSTIEYCYNSGTVETWAANVNASAGGILGHTPGSAATIRYCINRGAVRAQNSIAGGIGVSLYGNITADHCYNSGTVYGNSATNPNSSAGGIVPKAPYGSGDKANYCLNAGEVVAETGTAYAVCNGGTGSYYYDNSGVLKTSAGAEAELEAALATLNTGDNAFFAMSQGVIIPSSLASDSK